MTVPPHLWRMENFLCQLARLIIWAELQGATEMLPRRNGYMFDKVALPKLLMVRGLARCAQVTKIQFFSGLCASLSRLSSKKRKGRPILSSAVGCFERQTVSMSVTFEVFNFAGHSQGLPRQSASSMCTRYSLAEPRSTEVRLIRCLG